ncbi:MAG: chromosome segregation protein SMC [Lachnospiraceae bacterium]|nr:chromosome segregation protein SMC [Lachnospiraceae bacterium]
MYLKSIQMHGFKSFANKIVLDFHNGITGIVGPNGSGKSNVADAVRWVLGEQSAKQLRGSSMQDVIFSGTENRKQQSYAYVSITLDNSDHVLPIDFEEVTITRRVFRSGESEYLLNGTNCRLRDVNELFYDTGIGKEGYSIIGQGQIEKILSGRPEERRELFDEAVGIVKYKKRKAASIKKLQEQEENLTRVSDILAELERQVGPLEEQAKTAREFLAKREKLKKFDINMFLMETERIEGELDKINGDYDRASQELKSRQEENEKIRDQYYKLEQQITAMDEKISKLRDDKSEASITKEKLENQILLLEEQIRSAKTSDETNAKRRVEIEGLKKEHVAAQEEYIEQEAEIKKTLDEVSERLSKARDDYKKLEEAISLANSKIEENNKELLLLMEQRARISSEEEGNRTLLEQTNIRRSQLTSRILSRKTREELYENEKNEKQEAFEKAKADHENFKAELDALRKNRDEIKQKQRMLRDEENTCREELTKKKALLESLQNIAERYEGYGRSVKAIMEKKELSEGICGVVADLIHVDKKYETAIETALGGNIQNIVTEDDQKAKELIAFLKKEKAGRATFLPLNTVRMRDGFAKEDALSEKGAIGVADSLVSFDNRYEAVASHLLGNIMICDTVDNALSIAKKYKQSLHIVTLEGEYIRPGGSLSGGSFKHNANLLGRMRQIDELEKKIKELGEKEEKIKEELSGLDETSKNILSDIQSGENKLSELAIEENTAKLNLSHATEQVEESKLAADSLKEEGEKLEETLRTIENERQSIETKKLESQNREEQLKNETKELGKELDKNIYMETSAAASVREIELEEATAKQREDNALENLNRIKEEISRDDFNLKKLSDEALGVEEDTKKKEEDIIRIRETIAAAGVKISNLDEDYKKSLEEKDRMNTDHKNFFSQKEELTSVISTLEKEIMRLENIREKNEAYAHEQSNYMWNEYELTLRQAKELRDPELNDRDEMRKEISTLKSDIRQMGSVNVNAIEEYREVSERYEFLSTQHTDLTETKEKLIGIIDELDTGMREQFSKGFADIRVEFDKAFKELFGGGAGNLELQEDEDLLESGIKIIAQPPGKKLQNMMQLSGGEKSLTAIALLFAIQNLKPSPFCLLDEIEAALDDSNVDRFASYLHKLTKNTQFIVITHRRGTMNTSDRLYGITMQEKGISTLVSVNLVEADLDD